MHHVTHKTLPNVVCNRFAATYDADKDSFGSLAPVPPQLGVAFLIVPCFILACALHPNLNKDFLSDMTWTFSMYLESLAVAPQLYMFAKQAGGAPIEVLVAHCVAALGFARVVEMAFWLWSFHELSDASGSTLVGYFVLVVQVMGHTHISDPKGPLCSIATLGHVLWLSWYRSL